VTSSRKFGWSGHLGDEKWIQSVLSGSLKERGNLEGFKRRRGDNIKADSKEIFRVYVICIQLIRARFCDDFS
jgi:hypothetical protein